MEDETAEIWSTKYAMTDGVTNHSATIRDAMAIVRGGRQGYDMFLHGEGKEWHRTEAGAKIQAEAIRGRKIKSMEKKLAKLQAIFF